MPKAVLDDLNAGHRRRRDQDRGGGIGGSGVAHRASSQTAEPQVNPTCCDP
jgi:hypothetical protein